MSSVHRSRRRKEEKCSFKECRGGFYFCLECAEGLVAVLATPARRPHTQPAEFGAEGKKEYEKKSWKRKKAKCRKKKYCNISTKGNKLQQRKIYIRRAEFVQREKKNTIATGRER